MWLAVMLHLLAKFPSLSSRSSSRREFQAAHCILQADAPRMDEDTDNNVITFVDKYQHAVELI